MPSSGSNTSAFSNASVKSSTSIVSQTSTVEYGHEPFEQYVSKVKQLCHMLWPLEIGDFIIERLQGGSYNRIIGITPPSSSLVGDHGKSYILRIPRWDEGKQEQELAILRYVHEHSSLPVASIISSDATDNNPLSSPYVIQSRISGRSLFDSYQSLTSEQQKAIARDLATILLKQQAVRNKMSGVIEATTDGNSGYNYRVRSFTVNPQPDISAEHQIPSDTSSARDMYLTLFRLHEASVRQNFPKATYKARYYRRLATVAEQMDEAGLFKDLPNCLVHLDLMPRNLMVEIRNDGSATICGVLDWDSAIIAPIFMSCSAPSWIWDWAQDDDEDEARANNTPESPEMQALKRTFEETVGPQFFIYSYNAEYQLARRLFELAQHGIKTNEAHHMADNVLNEWRKMRVRFGLPDESDEEEEDEWAEDDGLVDLGDTSVDEDGYNSDHADGETEHGKPTLAVEETTACLEETHM